jgi:hypothetical protein
MSAARPLIILALVLGLILAGPGSVGPSGPARAELDAGATAVADLEGRGIWDKLLCVGCIGTWVFVGGSGAGMVVAAVAFPELPGMCAYGCIRAVLT